VLFILLLIVVIFIVVFFVTRLGLRLATRSPGSLLADRAAYAKLDHAAMRLVVD
jgi:hypothetical protein